METFWAPVVLVAVCTALAGVLVFAFAPYLPSVFPPAFARLVGFASVCAALAPLWAAYESWTAPAVLGGAALTAMIVIHVLQVRRASSTRDGSPDSPSPEPAPASEPSQDRSPETPVH